ncbi:MAG TPA: hypothetical protein VGP72_15510 [Planctomycetota bacterium]|jgi:hypothetical protein
MAAIKIDADALYRAVTASGFKLLAYHLDLQTGAITSRTMRPDEIADAPQGPSVKPLPKMGGDLTPKKDALPFGPLPVAASKKKLFGDEDLPKKQNFGTDFWKRDDKRNTDPFGGGGFRRESGSKKLAEIFGDAPKAKKADPFAKAAPDGKPEAGGGKRLDGETGGRGDGEKEIVGGRQEARGKNSNEPASEAASVNPKSEIRNPQSEDAQHPRVPVAPESQQLEWMHDFARDCGDPEIRDRLYAALKSPKPAQNFERTLRNYQRMGQQFERYFRKVALACAEAWLSELGVAWELIENG